MVFGFFKKKQSGSLAKKSFDWLCPLCEREYFIKFNPNEISDWEKGSEGEQVTVAETSCEFCNTDIELVFLKKGEIVAIDKKWQAVENKCMDEISKIEEEVLEIEDQIDDIKDDSGEENNPEIEKLRKKKARLERKQEKLEDAFSSKEDRYADRAENWRDKWSNKLEKLKR